MAKVITQQSTENMEYVRNLLKQNQPAFSAALELAAENAAHAIASHASGCFARGFATADGDRVVIAALNQRQFTDLARATRLAGMFAFLERLLHADFSDRGDLYTHRDTIAALLAAWFARRTVADLAAAFGGTSVPWARLDPWAVMSDSTG
jgi:crotonobetainyl-CoA:carnitine CoA-transferase CaiB-like acyl-CoA transferase